ncbi:MAG: SIMPL domain-containing protein [Flavobacteriales bacterium]|nr:SIMPL domain-containing protein [Flavobacteriales bacterium]
MHFKTTGEVEIRPDVATFSVTISCKDIDVVKSKNCLVEKSKQLNELLSTYEIAPKDMLTTAITQQKDYDWIKNSYIFSGYESSMTTHVTARNLKKLEELYPLLLSNSEFSVGLLQFDVSDYDSLSNLAYGEALNKADKLANGLLQKLNAKSKEIIKIGNIELPQGYANDEFDKKVAGNFEIETNDNVSKQKLQINNGTMRVVRPIYVEYIFY